MSATRWATGAVGLAMIAVGVWSMRGFDADQLVSMVVWLAGGVVAHDLVLAPLTLLVLLLGTRVLPARARPAAVVGLVVWGGVTIATANVLLDVGGRPDNPTLLNRPYVAWWLVLSAAWWTGVAVVAWWTGRRGRALTRGA
ncbi:hypothetical protein GCM10009821_27740 [Aeromicrobium halocynthiae]|uniref:DUF3995 domain-containing protein n=1 Tax=Aeromicrobium halocynthiae TaxID=560557 RepID=A0ABP5HRB0_9ACTN